MLTVSPAPASMTYGGVLPKFGFTVEGFVNGDTVQKISGAPVYATGASAAAPAGTYAVTVTQGTLASANYSFQFASGTIAVNKAVLTIEPDAAAMTYGGAVPALTWSLSGFVNGDTAAVVAGSPALTTTASSGSSVGTYAISAAAGTLTSVNYSFAGAAGKIVVGKAVLTVSAPALAMIYGGTRPALSYQITGFVNGDTQAAVSGSASVGCSAYANTPVGVYPLTVSLGTLSAANYSFVAVASQITIAPATLTVKGAAQTMVYGASVPALTYTITGFMPGDSIAKSTSGVAAVTTAASSASSVGSYATSVARGTLAAQNYVFQFLPGTLSITAATLTVTADNLTMKTGSTVPALTYSVSGLVNGDTVASATTGVASLSTQATAASKAGSYVIAITQGTLAAANYKFKLVNGTLTITN